MDPPTSVEVREVKADSITLTWMNSSDQKCRFLIIEYRMKNETEWTESDPMNKTHGRATISRLEQDTEYVIRVTAVGKQGFSAKSDPVTAVTAKTTRNPPTNVVVKEVRVDSITLTWTNPSDQRYRFLIVEYRMTHETKWTDSDPVKELDTLTLSGLKPDTEYEIKVTAMCKKGFSVSSDVVTALTAKTSMNPPTKVKVKEEKAESITLTWRNPSNQQHQILIIEYRMKGETKWTSHSVMKNQEIVTLSGLEPDTEYEIRFRAMGKKGCSVSSDIVTAVTTKTTMNPPTNVKVTEVKTDTLTLTWTNPPDQECKFLIIEYRRKRQTEWTSHFVQKKENTVTLSGLEPETKYEIRAIAVGELNYFVSSEVVTTVTAKRIIISPPSSMNVTRVKANSITLSWKMPNQCEGLKQYIIEFKTKNNTNWQKEETKAEVYTYTLNNLKCNTTYSIRMLTEAHFGMSKPGEEIRTKTSKQGLDMKMFILHSKGNPDVYRLKLDADTSAKFNKKIFGQSVARSLTNKTMKTIMLVGATGSGKTTLINGMTNYILGVNWEDNWRFKLIDEELNVSQAHSQTSEVTAYQIHPTGEFQVPYAVTIIDTPGFGDTKGIMQDRKITEKIREFFLHKDGIDAIDAVCFVVQASLARLTHTQRYIFEAILAVFGNDIASNIITLVTFADGKSPPVLQSIVTAEIPCAMQANGTPVFFKFNNSVLFANNIGGSSDERDFDHMFWKIGNASMKNFFTQLGKMETRSLTLTKQVLQERKQLEATVTGVQPLIRHGLATMEEIRSTQAVLDRHKTEIEENKDFEYEVEIEKPEKINITGEFVTNCHGCNFTCHYPCYIPNDADKAGCSAMLNGSCTVCPGKCVWSVHHNMTFRWELKRVNEKKTYNELKSKYEKALGEKMSAEELVAKLEEEYHQVQGKVVDRMDTLAKCLKRLKEIALRPDPLSTPDYIDLMIKSEEQEAKPGFKQRIKELQVVREGAVLMQKVSDKVNLSEQEASKLKLMKSKVKTFHDYLKNFR